MLFDAVKGIVAALVPGLHPASFAYSSAPGVALAYGIFLTLSLLPSKYGAPHPHAPEFSRRTLCTIWLAAVFALLLFPARELLSIWPPRELLLLLVIVLIAIHLYMHPLPFVLVSVPTLLLLRLFKFSDIFPIFAGLYGGSVGRRLMEGYDDPFLSALAAIPFAVLVAYTPGGTIYPLLALSGLGYGSVLPAAYAALHVISFYTYKPRTFLAIRAGISDLPFLFFGMIIGSAFLLLLPRLKISVPAIPVLFVLCLLRGFYSALIFLIFASLAHMLRKNGVSTYSFSGFLLLPTLVAYL